MGAPELDASELMAWRNAVASPWGPPQATTRHVLTTLSMHMNFELIASPSIDLLAVRSGLSDRAVSKHLQEAERLGWIESWYERRKGRAWFHTKYEGLWPGELEADDFMPGNCHPSDWRALDLENLPRHPERRSPRQESHPEPRSRHPEPDDTTPRTSVHDTPNEVPTNRLINSSLNSSGKEPLAALAVLSLNTEKSESRQTQKQPRSIADRLWDEVCKVGGYHEKGTFNLKAAVSAKARFDNLLMKHGDTRVLETWQRLDVQSIEHLEHAMEDKQ